MTILAWHFLQKGGKLRRGLYDETPEVPPPDGEWLIYPKRKYKIEICSTGLHASEKLFDARTFARSPNLCRVECDKIVEKDYDKLVCAKRRILWRVDPRDALDVAVRQHVLDTQNDFAPSEERFLISGTVSRHRYWQSSWTGASNFARECTICCNTGWGGFLHYSYKVLSGAQIERIIRDEAKAQYAKRQEKNEWLEKGI